MAKETVEVVHGSSAPEGDSKLPINSTKGERDMRDDPLFSQNYEKRNAAKGVYGIRDIVSVSRVSDTMQFSAAHIVCEIHIPFCLAVVVETTNRRCSI